MNLKTWYREGILFFINFLTKVSLKQKEMKFLFQILYYNETAVSNFSRKFKNLKFCNIVDPDTNFENR